MQKRFGIVKKLPVYTLRVSAYDKDFYQPVSEITFSDQETWAYFEYSYTGATPEQIILVARNAEGDQVYQQPLSVPEPGQVRRFSLDLRVLPTGDYFAFKVEPQDADGNELLAASTPAFIGIAEADPIPFMFASFSVQDLLDRFPVPGLVVGVSCPLGEKFVFSAGVRRHDSTVYVQDRDTWHIGSNSKQFTTTLLARLIDERPNLDWSTTLGELIQQRNLIPSLRRPYGVFTVGKLHPTHDDTTLEQLVTFRSGMALTHSANAPTRQLTNYSNDPSAFRLETVGKMLSAARARPRGTFRYGQGEYMIVSTLIEHLEGKPFEDVMQEKIFDALELESARFGMPTDMALSPPPSTPTIFPGGDPPLFGEASDNPWVVQPMQAYFVQTTAAVNGHLYPDQKLETNNLGMPPVWNAPGGITIDMYDLLDFWRFHVTRTPPSGTLSLSGEAFDKLHTAYQGTRVGPGGATYGPGFVSTSTSLGLAINHNGSYGRFYSRAIGYTDRNIVVAAISNAQPGRNSENPDNPDDPFPFFGDDVVEQALDWAAARAQTDCPMPPPVATESPALEASERGAATTRGNRQIDAARDNGLRVTSPVATRTTTRGAGVRVHIKPMAIKQVIPALDLGSGTEHAYDLAYPLHTPETQ